MTIPSVSYGRYAPEQVKVDSITIGVSTDFHQNPGFNNSQYLAVGEFQRPNGDKAFNLFVDHEGISVRTSIPQRSHPGNEYALFVDGDVYVTGRVLASNMLQAGEGSNAGSAFVVLPGESGGACNCFWGLAHQTDSLYFNGKVTIGNLFQAQQNTHALNVAESADHTIDHSQLAIDNTQGAQVRLGILGNSRASPAVVNTPPGTQLEFHIGRDQSYFYSRYLESNIVPVYDPNTGDLIEQRVDITTADTPDYSHHGPETAPHLMVDANGNVGVHTSAIPSVPFQVRKRDPLRLQEIKYYPTNEPMALHVDGSLFGSNIVLWDHQSLSPKHLDELYVRRMGVTIPAEQIEPGAFAHGQYQFRSNVGIMGPPEEAYALLVHDDAKFLSNLNIEGTTTTDQLVTTDAMVLDIASFYNDVYFKSDVIVNEAIRLRGQIFVETLSDTVLNQDGSITSNYSWKAIDFAPSGASYSNINIIGQGIATPGRFGSGIGPNDEVNHQVAIVKRDPGERTFNNMFQIHLDEKTSPYFRKSAWIGHPAASVQMPFDDGSMVIATPATDDPMYTGLLPRGLQQNIYLFPGVDMHPSAPLVISPSNTPTLGAFHNKRVGIHTFEPRHELDVRGSVCFSENLIYFDQETQQENRVGLWKSKTFSYTGTRPFAASTYNGIQYENSNEPCVGIMARPDPFFSLNVRGGVKVDGLFNSLDRKFGEWYDKHDAYTSQNHIAPASSNFIYTWANTGVGVKDFEATLALKDNYRSPHGTRLQLVCGDTNTKRTTSVAFDGVNSEAYLVQHDNDQHLFEIGRIEHLQSNTTPRALWTKYNSVLKNYQVVVGCNLLPHSSAVSPDPNAILTVGGDMAVLGSVNITGAFQVNSRYVTSNDTVPNRIPDLDEEDVYLGGNHILLLPDVDKTVCVGTPYGGLDGEDKNSVLRVYQETQGKPIATFRGVGENAYIEVAGSTSTKLRIGVKNPATDNVPYQFMDQDGDSFLSFYSTGTQQTGKTLAVGFGGITQPSASLHIGSFGDGGDMLRLTKLTSTNSTTDACPSIDLEKQVPLKRPTRWTIKGPFPTNTATPDSVEKIAFLYSDHDQQTQREVFAFTNNGCLGLNNPTPEYALDVINTGAKGSLRLLNTDVGTATPQLILQSGSPEFASDESFDFRMTASNDTFMFDMENIHTRLPILSITSNNFIGIRGPPSDTFPVEVTGDLNVTNGSLYVNGVAVLDGVSVAGGTVFRAANSFFMPNQYYNGGVAINKDQPTGNLFYIHSSFNENLLVLDSSYKECQMHYRVQEGGNSGKYNLWRNAACNTQLYWSYFDNCSNALTIDPSMVGHSNAMMLEPGIGARSNEFNLTVYGQARLVATDPAIHFGDVGRVEARADNMYVLAKQNVGVGTSEPSACVHVYNSDASNRPVMLIEQVSGTQDLVQVVQQYGASNTNILTAAATGHIGIGTASPIGMLHVASGQVLVANGSIVAPSYAFASSPQTGIYSPLPSALSVSTAGSNRLTFLSNGDIQIGSNITIGQVTIAGSTGGLGAGSSNKPLFAVHQQQGSADTFRVTQGTSPTQTFVINSQGNVGIGTTVANAKLAVNGHVLVAGSIVPAQNEIHDLGSEYNRWRDLYLSGTTIDLGGTLLSKAVDDNVKITRSSDGAYRSIVVDTVEIQKRTGDRIVINGDAANGINFTTYDPALPGTSNTFVPLLANNLNNTVSFGNTSKTGKISIETADTAGMTIEQSGSSCNHMEFWTDGELKTVINNNGYIGIGSSNPTSRLTIQSDGGLMASFLSDSLLDHPTVIDHSGNVGIHTTVPNVALHVVGSNILDGRSLFTSNVYMATNLEVWGNTLTHGNSVTDSDIRLKSDLKRIDSALDKVCNLTGYTFTLLRDHTRSTGLIAQEVVQVLPEAVSSNNEYLGVSYGNLVGLLVEAIKELRQEVHDVKKQINSASYSNN